jgi:hypothetical protein
MRISDEMGESTPLSIELVQVMAKRESEDDLIPE